jgi:hypothetical protein
LWRLLDSLHTTYLAGTCEDTDSHDRQQPPGIDQESATAVRSDLR